MNNQNYKLSEITTLIARGITPKYTDSADSISVINQKCIRDGKINFDLCRKHNHQSKRISSEKILQMNDILINSTGVGTLGRVSQIIDDLSQTTCDSHVTIVRPDPTKVNPSFLGAFTYLNQKIIESLGHGSTGQTELSRLDLGEIDIPKLSDKKQKFIGEFFQFFNKKIELNQKTNEILEGIVKALFKSWFVDFDPVKAKSEGLSTGLADEISDLFPDSFEDSKLGQLPKDWNIYKLGDVISIKYGKNFPTKNLQKSGYPVFGGNGIIGYHSNFLYEEQMTLMSCRGAASGGILRSLPMSFITNNSLVMDHLSTRFPSQRYLELFLQSRDRSSFVTGSAQPQVTIESIYDFLFLVPNFDLLKYFQKLIEPLNRKSLLLIKQNKDLAFLRDLLLPKLISEELRIPDAEKMISEVGI